MSPAAPAPPHAPATAPDPWILRRQGDLARPAFEETLFALSNGALGVRAGLEYGASPTQASFLSGLWERSPIEYHERFPGFAAHTDTRLPVADGTRIGLHLGDTEIDPVQGECLHHERQLDLAGGRFERLLRWRSKAGHSVEIRSERVVPLNAPALLCLRLSVRSIDYHGPLRLSSALVTDRAAVGQGDDPRFGVRVAGGLRRDHAEADVDGACTYQHTLNSGIGVACGQRHRDPGNALRFVDAGRDSEGAWQTFEATLEPGREVVLEKFVAYAWSTPGAADSSAAALAQQVDTHLHYAVDAGFDAHLQAQRTAMQRLWATADLHIDGDAGAEQALRFNLFHVYQAAVRDGSGSVAAKGLSGEGYEGHYFWDAEAFALPALVGLDPALVRSMLGFRFHTLERARAHAREMNHERGALYAWRTISGDECSGYFPSGSAQYHINAAVAFAIGLYVDATGDDDFLREQGAEMLFETARIWLQIGHFSARHDGAFCIHEVTGPDEYTAMVNNNHYTNRMARAHLRRAVKTAQWMATTHADDYAALAARLGLDDAEIALWQRAAEAMYLPVDPQLHIFPQDDSFLDKPRWPGLGSNGGDKAPLLLSQHPLTLYRHQVCKQADVLLGLVLAGEDVDRAAKRRNLDYYEQVTVHDSTLSASTFGIVAAEVGARERAEHFFEDSLRVDLDDRHGNADHGVHIASMAGSWLGLSWGFGGLRNRDGELHFAPSCPSRWRGYRFGLNWRGRQLRIEVGDREVAYELREGAAMDIHHEDERIRLQPGRSERRPLRDHCALQAVIFDLDGVLADTAPLHQAAWAQLAAEIGIDFDPALGERLKGVDRNTSLEIVLAASSHRFSEAEKRELADRKNGYYRAHIAELGPQHLLPGAREALRTTRAAGLKVGLASASRNAPALLERLGIGALFDYIVDANRIERSKPDPEIFLAAAAGLGVAPSACLGVEDAVAGIASIRAAGMASLGIGRADVLRDADAVRPDLTDFDIHVLTGS